MEEPPPTPIISRYLLLIFIWSTTPLAVVLSIKDLHPIWALACRFTLAVPLSALCLSDAEREEVEAFLEAMDSDDDVQHVYVGLA